MTEKEAIGYIKRWFQPTTEPQERKKAIEALAVVYRALEEIQQYRAIGTVEEFQELKEKNTPKKIEYQGRSKRNYCPTCKQFLGWDYSWKYCKHCGQAIDRSERIKRGIIVIDIPERCNSCKFWFGIATVPTEYICMGAQKRLKTITAKPDWCPIKETPKKSEVVPLGEMSYVSGWNACIDEILGDSEQNTQQLKGET